MTGTEIANGKNNQNPAVAKGDEMAGYLTDAKVKNIKAEKLLEEYDAVVLACGASNPRDILSLIHISLQSETGVGAQEIDLNIFNPPTE